MNTDQIVSSLRAEINRLEKAITALTGTGNTPNGRRKRRGKRRLTAAGRKRLSQMLKARWAAGKMGKRKSK